MTHTILPNAEPIELAVLCACLTEKEAIVTAAELIKSEKYFYGLNNQSIWKALKRLYSESITPDLLVLNDALKRWGMLSNTLTEVYTCSLLTVASSGTALAFHIGVLKEKFLLREAILSAQTTIDTCKSEEKPATEILSKAGSDLVTLLDTSGSKRPQKIKDLCGELTKNIEILNQSNGGLSGISSGLCDLDKFTTGWHPGELIIVAARPGMGKTALGLTFALSAAKHQISTAFFSLEMPEQQIMLRMACTEAGVDSNRLRQGHLDKVSLTNVFKTTSTLSSLPFYLDDSVGITPMQLRAKCQYLKSQVNLGLVCIDYLQLLKSDMRHENRQQEVAYISKSLKVLAKELQIPVIALAQLNRAVESRKEDRRPQLSDIRESGQMEMDADAIIFIYREVVYNKHCDNPNTADLILAKQRNGPTGTAHVLFEDTFTRFSNLSKYGEEKISKVDDVF